MAVSITDYNQLHGLPVLGQDGEKLGKVDAVYLDQSTQRPEWVAVKSGLFGTHVSLVPLAAADLTNEELRVPFSKDQMQAAPHQDPDQELSPAEEAALFEHYGVPYGGETVTAQVGDRSQAGTVGEYVESPEGRHALEENRSHDETGRDESGRDTVGHDTSGPNTDQAMTRSEERLRVGTEQTEAGRARLRKYVVTENVTQTVPVSREEVRVEREPITEANRGDAVDGPGISEEEHEVTLHAERPVTQTETVPVERVRLGTETVTEQQEVGGEIRKEHIETDGVDTGDAVNTEQERRDH